MIENLHLLNQDLNQEEVAYLFSKYGLVSAAVVNENEKIIGSITVDDVVEVAGGVYYDIKK